MTVLTSADDEPMPKFFPEGIISAPFRFRDFLTSKLPRCAEPAGHTDEHAGIRIVAKIINPDRNMGSKRFSYL
jgi:hypothetical protein